MVDRKHPFSQQSHDRSIISPVGHQSHDLSIISPYNDQSHDTRQGQLHRARPSHSGALHANTLSCLHAALHVPAHSVWKGSLFKDYAVPAG